ncbi:MAG: hypothetical protein U0324_28140 [Polyangiales bacterium]
METPLPEPAAHACVAAPYRTAPPPSPAVPVPPPGVATAVFALIVALAALGAGVSAVHVTCRAARAQARLASQVFASAREMRPESRLDTAAQELARRARLPLFIAPDVDGRAAMRVIAAGSLDAPLADTVRALDAYAAPRGLWFHEAGGVLRLERAVTAADFDCASTLDACAERLARVASVQLVVAPGAGGRAARLHLTRDVPVEEATRAALTSNGFAVDRVGRTLYVAAPADDAPPNAAPTSLRRRGDGTFLVSRHFVDATLENQASLMRSTRIMPVRRDGRVVGVQVYGVRPDGLLAQLGLRNGDILTHVNDFEIASPDRCLEAYARLRNTDRLTLSFERAGRGMHLTYVIV